MGSLLADELFRDSPETWYEQTVASTWRAALEEVCKPEQLASRVFEMAAYVGREAIPRRLFSALVRPIDEHRLADALNVIDRFSLADVTHDAVGIHRLVQKIVRETMCEASDGSAAVAALHEPAADFPRDPSPPER